MFIFAAAGTWLASCAGACACQGCMFLTKEAFRKSARLAYCLLFLASMLSAWLLRDFAKPLIEKIPWIIRGDMDHSARWFGQQAVYRVSLGSFLFYSLLSVLLVGVKYKSDKRDLYLHHGGWFLKVALWLMCLVVPFFLPNNIVMTYSWFARVGSGLFLVLQMVILLDFTQSWNDAWVDKDDDRYLYGLLGVSIGCFVGVAGITGLLLYWFNPAVAGGCSFNVVIIVLSLLLCLVFSALSLLSQVPNGSLFPSACISVYIMYLAYGALESEPHNYECNALGEQLTAASGTTLAAGMLLTLVATTYSALRAGSNTHTFRLTDSDDELVEPLTGVAGAQELGAAAGPGEQLAHRGGGESKDKAMDEFQPVAYSYSQFHLIFALASMYIGMLMTGWGTGAAEKDLIDVGWASVWVKIAAQWLTGLLYIWTLVAPILLPDWEFH